MTITRVPDSATDVLERMATEPAGPRREELRALAVQQWLPLARHLARRYTGRGEPDDDLVQTAVLGLIKAVDRWDPQRGVEFASFAVPTVLGEIRRHFRDRTWSVRVPRRLQELRLAIGEANGHLTQALGRSPTVADIAAHLSLTEEDVLEGLEGAQAYQTQSLATPLAGGDGRTTLADTLGCEDHDLELAELRLALGPAVAALTERERTILRLRFTDDLTQTQIAERIGISQMHVSRLLARALAQLRTQLTTG